MIININFKTFILFFFLIFFYYSYGYSDSAYLKNLKDILNLKEHYIFDNSNNVNCKLAVDSLKFLLRKIPDKEKELAHQIIFNYIKTGFTKSNDNIFKNENIEVRQLFFNIINESNLRLNTKDISKIIDEYTRKPGDLDFSIFIEPTWISFVKESIYKNNRLSDKNIIKKSLIALLNSIDYNNESERYFYVCYFGADIYTKYSEIHKEYPIIEHVKNHALKSLTTQNINKYFELLNKDHWTKEELKLKRLSLLRKLGNTLYSFPVSKWLEVKTETCYALNKDSDYPIISWIKKIVIQIKNKKNNCNAELELLSFFIKENTINKNDIYNGIKEYFINDQQLFTLLHTYPELSAMRLLNKDKKNLNNSIDILEKFFSIKRHTHWNIELYDTLIQYYYSIYKEKRNFLFNNIITPIYKQAPIYNKIRQILLKQVRENISFNKQINFLTDYHRYKIAHYIFSNNNMKTLVKTYDFNKPDVLEYSVDIYTNIKIENIDKDFCFELSPHQKKIYKNFDSKTKCRLFINVVLKEPLFRLCDAFLTRPHSIDKGLKLDIGKDTHELKQLEKILNKIKDINKKFNIKIKKDLKILLEISDKTVKAIEYEINQSKDYSKKVISMIKLIFKICSIMESDVYLDQMLHTMKTKIYKINKKKFSKNDLHRSVNIFKSLHNDFLDALIEVKKEYLIKCYEDLYISLRNIKDFFKEVKADPYIDFINEIDNNFKNELTNLFEKEKEQFRDCEYFLEAESSFINLMKKYIKSLEINLWKETNRLGLNKNITLGVLYKLLINDDKQKWKDDQYQVINIFLNNIQNKDMLKKTSKDYYSPWNDFFGFLRSLLELYEINNFKFMNIPVDSLYSGNLFSKQGITVIVDKKQVKREKVNGELRQNFYNVFRNITPLTDNNEIELIKIALFLPNSNNNNICKKQYYCLEKYQKIKNDAFDLAKKNINSKTKPVKIFENLLWMARIVYSLPNNSKIKNNFIKFKNSYLNELNPSQKMLLGFEEAQLQIINNQTLNKANNIKNLNIIIQELIEIFFQSYDLLNIYKKGDDVNRAIISLFKKIEPSSMTLRIKEDHIKKFWFMMNKFEEVLDEYDKSKNNAFESDILNIISNILLIQQFFLPYMGDNFSIEHMLNEHSLIVFSMLHIRLKTKIYNILKKLPNSKKRNVKFILAHNFLPVHLLENSIKNVEIFKTLEQGKEIILINYNFNILAMHKYKGSISLENLINEAIAGFDLNKTIITEGKSMADEDYLEYFFGKAGYIMKYDKSNDNSLRNFDSMLKKIIKIPKKDYSELISKLINEFGKDHQVTKSAISLPKKIENILNKNGYNYFGKVIENNFSSMFSMQAAFEYASKNINSEKSNMNKIEYKIYNNFYINSIFDDDIFKSSISKNMTLRFYKGFSDGNNLKQRKKIQKDYLDVIDGKIFYSNKNSKIKQNILFETKGLVSFINPKIEFDKKYKSSFFNLLTEIFIGKGLAVGKPYIGDLVWKNDNGNNKMKPLPMNNQRENIYELLNWIYYAKNKYKNNIEIKNIFDDN